MYVYWSLFLDFHLSMRNRPEMQPIARFLSFAAINTAYKPKPYRMNYGVLGLSLTLIINTERESHKSLQYSTSTTKYGWQFSIINCMERKKIYCLILSDL